MENLEQQIIKKAIADIDLSKFKPEIEKAIQAYFRSESFAEEVSVAMSDGGYAYELADAIGKKMVQQLKKNIKISLSD